ncbi:hypothetical protein Moror_3794 [Moniliophthora roreri MCA 2997]|uniref:Uncharacterized protein n=1 Tax=Moniliophthora roreri (strain MCA 2997) TaxID=1381753 RepID=V2WVP0_MONRO|nr:hypothetical protein Moror_3794 [Moniliophthora roreri MCA 2997]
MDASGCSKILDGKPMVLFGIPSIYGLHSGRAGNERQKMPEFQCPPNHTSNKANRETCMYARFDQPPALPTPSSSFLDYVTSNS